MVPFLLLACVSNFQNVGDRPAGAIVLFDGSNTSEWVHRDTGAPCGWDVIDGALTVKAGTTDIQTKREFRDYRLHIEFQLPSMPDAQGQGRANSGVYNLGRYEVQVLDSYENPTYAFGGCGALYGQKDPDADAIRPPGWWNTYDIVFRAPRLVFLGNGTGRIGPISERRDAVVKVRELPRISVWHNGIRIHRDVELKGNATTSGIEGPTRGIGPILLQNHGAPIRYRNIWIVEG